MCGTRRPSRACCPRHTATWDWFTWLPLAPVETISAKPLAWNPPELGPGDHLGNLRPRGRQALTAAEEGLARVPCSSESKAAHAAAPSSPPAAKSRPSPTRMLRSDKWAAAAAASSPAPEEEEEDGALLFLEPPRALALAWASAFRSSRKAPADSSTAWPASLSKRLRSTSAGAVSTRSPRPHEWPACCRKALSTRPSTSIKAFAASGPYISKTPWTRPELAAPMAALSRMPRQK
mmetsp:Transcript_10026/g.23075  ORF Transcript_10026/g.23075 Transcript_10026/m.23075 type:complete len:235 (-) Transcript_10026:1576-2280(-)